MLVLDWAIESFPLTELSSIMLKLFYCIFLLFFAASCHRASTQSQIKSQSNPLGFSGLESITQTPKSLCLESLEFESPFVGDGVNKIFYASKTLSDFSELESLLGNNSQEGMKGFVGVGHKDVSHFVQSLNFNPYNVNYVIFTILSKLDVWQKSLK